MSSNTDKAKDVANDKDSQFIALLQAVHDSHHALLDQLATWKKQGVVVDHFPGVSSIDELINRELKTIEALAKELSDFKAQVARDTD